jgi:hypothetical protein
MLRYLAICTLTALLLGISLGLTSAAPAPMPTEPPFHAQLKKFASEYKTFGRVDDEMRWAPWLCRMPMPGVAHVSASKDAGTHGQKLYSLFVKDREAYAHPDPKKPVEAGQVIVKQSWVPEEVVGKKVDAPIHAGGSIPFTQIIREPVPKQEKPTLALSDNHFWPYAHKDGKVFKATKQADLFIMFKLDPKTPGTDNGWVYGTVSADGKTVTSAGRVESCMKCHQDAKADRLFGLRP